MKIIHTADIHLDSKVESSLPPVLAKERRLEILDTFAQLVDYAKDQGVSIVIIAGDLFDKPHVRKGVRRRLLSIIKENEGIDFLYLKGNHGKSDFLEDVDWDDMPANLKTFTEEEWTAYEYGKVVISGREISEENIRTIPVNLILDESKCNIVVLHGREPGYVGSDKTPVIPIQQFKGKFIDYMALGHTHEFTEGRIDDRGSYCYPGVLCGRSFTECGRKGFVLLDINDDSGRLSASFVPFDDRCFYESEAPVNEKMQNEDVKKAVAEALKDARSKDFVRVVLTGKKAMDFDVDISGIEEEYSRQYYFFKLVDKSSIEIDYEAYVGDRSLKGEFVRLMQGENLPEEEKASIIDLGMRAILGEEV